MDPEENMVDWVFSSTSPDQLRDRYDQWAGSYESDLEEKFGYVLPQRAAEAFAVVIPTGASILDAGVGTGLIGALMAPIGYANITGIDISQGMLDEAAKKDAYVSLKRMEWGLPLDFPDNAFDAVISAGSCGPGHAPPSSLDELVRITRPSGDFMFSFPAGIAAGQPFRDKADELVVEGRWELVSLGDPFAPMPVGEPEVLTNIWHYRVL